MLMLCLPAQGRLGLVKIRSRCAAQPGRWAHALERSLFGARTTLYCSPAKPSGGGLPRPFIHWSRGSSYAAKW
jgi:hypothetical protein